MKRFLFTCGGTAGHINPALALAGRLRELLGDCEVLFIGAKGMMETRLVPREGYEIREIDITNISRALSLEGLVHNAKTLRNVAASTEKARRILREFRPDAVIGTGGYVCYPVLTAAAQLHILTLVHESNAVPGLTTRLLSRHVDRVLVGFEDSREHYPHPDRVVVTGTPVRGEFASYTRERARGELGLTDDKPLVVSLWGSLGSAHMNGIMTELIPMMRGDASFHLIHAAGSRYFPEVTGKLALSAPDYPAYGADVREYIYDMPLLMAAADLILCRAGASTISELCYLGRPVLMVPSPNVTNNHQEKNARVLEHAGGAEVLLEGEFDADSLLQRVKALLADREKLADMEKAMRSLAVRDATDRIVSTILELCRQ